MILFWAIVLITGCSLKKPQDDIALWNDTQTNAVKNIISVEDAKEKVVRDIIESGYARSNGMVLGKPETTYLKEVEWGPVIFVENLKENDLYPKYYYLFYGQMPDGSLPAVQAVDAQTGEVFKGGVMNYHENRKIFLLTPSEITTYVKNKLCITSSNQMVLKAVFYSDEETANGSPIESWKYEIRMNNGSAIQTLSVASEAVYVDPFIAGPEKVAPNPTNTASLFIKSRLLTLRLPSTPADAILKSVRNQSGAHFVPID